MRLVIGGDHAGFELKQVLKTALNEWGHQVEDVGSFGAEAIDFPDVARTVGAAILSGQAERGIIVCGTGIGAAMAANKIPGIRAALCHDVHSAHQSVEHDDANVLCLGAKIVGEWLAYDLVQSYLQAEYSGEASFQRRLDKLAAMERTMKQAPILELSDERRAELMPKLNALIVDLQQIDAIVGPDTEPVLAGPWTTLGEVDNDR